MDYGLFTTQPQGGRVLKPDLKYRLLGCVKAVEGKGKIFFNSHNLHVCLDSLWSVNLNFDFLLAMHLSIFISVFNQLDA